jgi:hypothetical protein
MNEKFNTTEIFSKNELINNIQIIIEKIKTQYEGEEEKVFDNKELIKEFIKCYFSNKKELLEKKTKEK